MLNSFVGGFEIYNHKMLWSSSCATQNCLEIWRHIAGHSLAVFSENPWLLSRVFLQTSRKRREDSVLYLCSFLHALVFFLQICAQPSRVKCCCVACRAALLPCQLCMSFVYIWFGRTFHDKNQGLRRLWTGGWLGRGTAGWGEREKIFIHLLLVAHQMSKGSCCLGPCHHSFQENRSRGNKCWFLY